MKATKYSRKPRITSGGQAGMRGYLVQTLIALLEALTYEVTFTSIVLEPNNLSEKFDIIINYKDKIEAIQVKSTRGQFSFADVEKWANELEVSGFADEYKLSLIGLHSWQIVGVSSIKGVKLELKNLDITAAREQAAHRLDRFLSKQQIESGSAEYREMLVDALIARLAAYSTTGKSISYHDLVSLLNLWITKEPNPRYEEIVLKLSEISKKQVETKLLQSGIHLKYETKYYVPRSLEGEIEKLLNLKLSIEKSNCFLVLAPAGCGKTNLLCKIASKSVFNRPTFLLTGAQLLIDEDLGLWLSLFDVLNDITKIERRRSSILSILKTLSSLASDVITIVIDAINEYHDPVLLKRELNKFLIEARTLGIAIVASCRDYYWGLFDAPWWNEFLKSSSDNSRKNNKFQLGNFSVEESEGAFKLYFQGYGISVHPEGNAREQLRHPLLLRFFCETHQGMQIGALRDIRLKDLFDQYWVTKVGSIAERIMDQGELGIFQDISDYISECILAIASKMLQENIRAIPVSQAHLLTHSTERIERFRLPYGRILDEHIILEEISLLNPNCEKLVAFVFEEFMEYSMAKSLTIGWYKADITQISESVINVIEKYDSFNQVFGVILYAALMLKQERGIELWPVLIGLGTTWEKVVIEAFKKLPADQIDDGVFEAIIELLKVPRKEIQIEALELLKYGRLRRLATKELTKAVGLLVTHDDLKIRRRAILALNSCPAQFAIPLLEKGITTRMHRITDQYVVVPHTLQALAIHHSLEAILIIAKAVHGYWHSNHNLGEVAILLEPDKATLFKLTDHDDFLVRIGSISILGYTSLTDAVPVLESILLKPKMATTFILNDQLPDWVDETSRRFIQNDFDFARNKKLSIEQYLANKALERIRKSIMTIEERNSWEYEINEALTKMKPGELVTSIQRMIDESYYDLKIVSKIIKIGVEQRSSKKWHVYGNWERIIIKSPRGRLTNNDMTIDERAELASLLNIKEVSSSGLEIGTRYWHNDFWKEYIYRAWGIKPLIKGWSDHWD